MSHEIVMRRVRIGALLLMIAVGLELGRYVYKSFQRALEFAFLKPDLWNNHWRVDDGVVVELWPRIGYFTIWTIVILASVAGFLAGLHLLNRVRNGKIFDITSAHSVRRLGWVLALAMFLDFIFHSIDLWLLTRFNEQPIPIRFGYDPSDIKTFSMAMILFLFGWVMQKSIAIESENRGFV